MTLPAYSFIYRLFCSDSSCWPGVCLPRTPALERIGCPGKEIPPERKGLPLPRIPYFCARRKTKSPAGGTAGLFCLKGNLHLARGKPARENAVRRKSPGFEKHMKKSL